MTWVDGVILGAMVLALLNGFRRGAVMQVFSWGGFVLGLFAGGFAALALVRAVEPATATAQLTLSVGAFLVVAFLVEGIVAMGGARIGRRIVGEGARKANALTGSVVAMIMVLVVAWLFTPAVRRVPEIASAVHGSAILRATDAVMPGSPPNILHALGGLLDRTGFPEVFAQLNPSLAPGVEPPPPELAEEEAVIAAARLTYKIEGRGCAGRVNGSGFPVQRNKVITAAHVVAGTEGTVVITAADAGGERYDARVVYIDTDTDIAVLHVPGLPNRLLDVEPTAASRGTDGAAIGYPGGGDRTISVSRVRTRTNAQGQDIYSQKRVVRQIYVMHAEVRQGNSGGPFVDTGGRVRGMVFAASATDPNESYALAETEIFRALEQGGSRTRAVNTGRCSI